MFAYKKVKITCFTVLVIILAAIYWLRCLPQDKKYFFLNFTKSMPRGLYKVTNQLPKTGDTVIIDLPSHTKKFYVDRGYIKQDTLLLKKILAGENDFVCQNNYEIIIKQKSYNQYKLSIRKLDRDGRKLPATKICRKLNSGEFFVGGIDKDYSLDSRYFGIISSSEIINTVNHIL